MYDWNHHQGQLTWKFLHHPGRRWIKMNHCSLRPLETVGSSIYSRPIHICYLSTSLWLGIFQVPNRLPKSTTVEHQARLINSKRRDFPSPTPQKNEKTNRVQKVSIDLHTSYIHKFSWAISIVAHLWVTFTHWLLSTPPNHGTSQSQSAWHGCRESLSSSRRSHGGGSPRKRTSWACRGGHTWESWNRAAKTDGLFVFF